MATTGREQIPLLPERRQTKAPTWEQVRRTFYDISAFEIYQEGVVKEHFYDELSDIQNLTYLFEKYKFTVERGKPNLRAAKLLKTYIDIIQVKEITNEQPR
jgi:hypothetical protein